MLKPCNQCKENSVVSKIYIRKEDGVKKAVEFCLNKGCGYRRDMSIFLREEKKVVETVS